nr:hypothetical protein [Anaerolineae bacterium]
IVANDVTAPDAGFVARTNRVVILDRQGAVEELPLMSKAAVAEVVAEAIVRGVQADESTGGLPAQPDLHSEN